MMFFFVPLLALFFLLFFSESWKRSLDRRARTRRRTLGREKSASDGFAKARPSIENEVASGYDNLPVQVFRLAARNKGCVTLSDVIVETGLDIDEAEKLMDRMVDGSHVRIEVTEIGMITYEFPELMAGIDSQEA